MFQCRKLKTCLQHRRSLQYRPILVNMISASGLMTQEWQRDGETFERTYYRKLGRIHISSLMAGIRDITTVWPFKQCILPRGPVVKTHGAYLGDLGSLPGADNTFHNLYVEIQRYKDLWLRNSGILPVTGVCFLLADRAFLLNLLTFCLNELFS